MKNIFLVAFVLGLFVAAGCGGGEKYQYEGPKGPEPPRSSAAANETVGSPHPKHLAEGPGFVERALDADEKGGVEWLATGGWIRFVLAFVLWAIAVGTLWTSWKWDRWVTYGVAAAGLIIAFTPVGGIPPWPTWPWWVVWLIAQIVWHEGPAGDPTSEIRARGNAYLGLQLLTLIVMELLAIVF
ncbi:MAG: hypothetical protein AAB592_01725 [Patescibacteria group bacterium]